MLAAKNLDAFALRSSAALIVATTLLILYRDYHVGQIAPITTILLICLFLAWDFGDYKLETSVPHPLGTFVGGIVFSWALLSLFFNTIEGVKPIQGDLFTSWLPLFPLPITALPFSFALAAILLLLGLKGLWKFRLVLFFLIIPDLWKTHHFVESLFNIDVSVILSEYTAQVAGGLLWYFGIDNQINGIDVMVPGGLVSVKDQCSGSRIIYTMLVLSICSVVYSVNFGPRKYLLPFFAIVIGFLANSIRIAILALLNASGTKDAFDFFHEANGQQVFILLSLGLFIGIYFLLRRPTPLKTADR